METVELWPFSQGELHGGLDRFVDVIFNDDWRAALDLPGIGSTSREDYLERALCGGVPRGGYGGANLAAPNSSLSTSMT